MNQILYKNRCKCNEELTITKKRKFTIRSEGKPLQYPKSSEIRSKTFQIKYTNKLSLMAKFILNSFHNKYLYYAIDDILYQFQLDQIERDEILTFLYSPVISLQNNFSVNFFDIWIREIYIEENRKTNRFLNMDSQISNSVTYITIKFFYKNRVTIKKQESLW